MRKQKTVPVVCPICDKQFQEDEKYKRVFNIRTKHHIFPNHWYKGGLKVYVCSECHTYEFHFMFPMGNRVWTVSECVQNWVKFCKSKGKDAYVIYPELKELKPLY